MRRRRRLFDLALKGLRGYERVEWIAASEMNEARGDMKYPALTQAAAFVYTSANPDGHCGPPIYLGSELSAKIEMSASGVVASKPGE